MITTEQLIAAIEAKATEAGLSPSTVGEKTGQGGQFYARLKDGKRVWPDTAERVMERLEQMVIPPSGAQSARAST